MNPTADLFEQKTKDDYFGKSSNVQVFTGQSLYEDVKKLLLGTLEDRETVAAFQGFLGESFFQGHPVALIPRHEGELHVKIGHEKEYPIHELGDGIQAIIALTFPLFKLREQHLLVFVEEPEVYLHPGLQRLFLNVLLNTPGFSTFQHFIATHSNHFLDLTLDLEQISVFTFRKELEESAKKERDSRFLVENVSNEDTQTLQLLGVKNSSVFFSNCTIWVEGVTDRRYFAHFLTLYEEFLVAQNEAKPSRRFKQDLHYSFVEYGGANITHWSVLDGEADRIIVERLCGRLYLITDSDNASSGAKKERQDRLREKLKERYCCLPCREVENLLTPDILRKVVQEYEPGTVVFAEISQEQYNNAPLGTFIENTLLKGAKKRRGGYAESSGTISDKVDFCNKAIRHLKAFSDLSPQAQQVTKSIYVFIEEQNPR
jgi:hypothetical protein